MADIKKLLESIDSMSKAVKKPSGPKFPGYWKGTEPASKSRSRMVGAQESIVKELHSKTTTLEHKLQRAYEAFTNTSAADDSTLKVYNNKNGGATFTQPNKPAPAATTAPSYTGIDPVVRQRMGMQPATQDEIRTYLDKNPPFVTSGDGTPIRSGTGTPVVSGGQTAVGRAADAASPDRERAEAMPRPEQQQQPSQITVLRKPTITLPPSATATPVTSNNVQSTAVAPGASTASTVTKPAAPTKPAVPTMPAKVQAGSWQDVWKNNPQLKNPNLIFPGQQIKLPDGTMTVVDKGDTLSSIAKRYRQGAYREGTPVNEGEPGDLEHELNRREYHHDKIAGRYDPDDFDQMVLRVKKLAQKQEREHGPVDLARLAKRLAALDNKDRKEVKEYDNAQDPNAQVTSPSDPKPSTASQQSQQQANMKDQAVDMATAKSTTATLKNVLGPKFDPSQAATGIVKANDGKPMSPQEQQAMGSITPLVMKAAETPSASGQLKSALQNAGLMAKQGK